MSIRVQCPNPHCSASSQVGDSINGRGVRCKRCGTPFTAKPTMDGRLGETGKGKPAAHANPFPTLPAEFGRYRILRLLGKGGMGAVYLADDSQLGRKVALKVPFFDAADSPQRAERFVREARSAAVLQHPNICTVYDAGQIDGRPFITMAYIDGTPLEKEIDAEALMPQSRAAELVRKIALALEHAHQKGIVHRDLKPANVMTAGDEPVVMDFGLAKKVVDVDPNEVKLTRDGGLLGTPSYMAPEQVKGDSSAIGPSTDVYALGVILFEMLTGRTPFIGGLTVVIGQILAAPAPPAKEFRPDVDARLDAICQKALAKAPAERFRSMTEFADALGQYQKEPTMPLPIAAVVKAPTMTAGPTWMEDLEDASRVARLKQPTRRPVANAQPLWKKWPILAGAAVALLLMGSLIVWAVYTLRVKTPDGILVVEVNEPDSVVEVLSETGKVEITRRNEKGPLSIAVDPGKHRLRVRKDGFELFTQEFAVEAKGATTISAKLEPLETKTAAIIEPKKIAEPVGKPTVEEWMKQVAAMPAEKQVEAVAAKLKELNPRFDGKETHQIEDGVVTGLNFRTDQIMDISPVRALTGLHALSCSGSAGVSRFSDLSPLKDMKLTSLGCESTQVFDLTPLQGMKLVELDIGYTKVSELSPLKDMKLTRLVCWGTPVSDLSPLKGMPLTDLECNDTQISDLSPLKGMLLKALGCNNTRVSDLSLLKEMPLTNLNCRGTPVTDLAPLKGLPLQSLYCDFRPERDAASLRSIKTLEIINDKPAAEFWKEVEAGEKPAAPADGKGWVSLFNGKDLSGWKVHPSQPGNWRVDKGVLIDNSGLRTALFTERADYTDFHLRLEVKLTQGVSGVNVRAAFRPCILGNWRRAPLTSVVWDHAYRAQIDRENIGGLFIDVNTELHRNLAPRFQQGEWTVYEVIAEGDDIVVKVNDEITCNYTDEEHLYAKGHIALPAFYSQLVEFRKIEIKELTSAKKKPAPATASDPFREKSVWMNKEQNITLTVLERKYVTFRARLTEGDSIDRIVTGAVSNGKVYWFAQNVEDRKGKTGFDNRGTFRKDKDGDWIDFTFGLGDESQVSGTYVLHQETQK